jgi:lactate permease
MLLAERFGIHEGTGRHDRSVFPARGDPVRRRAVTRGRQAVITLLQVLPFLAVVALLASGRATLMQAGLAGLALTLPAVALTLPPDHALLPFLLAEAPAGAWLAWHAVAVILAGFVFYRALGAADTGADGGSHRPITYRRLFAVCFLIGPFAESIIGVGVGAIVAAALLMRMGVKGPLAAALALFSQMLVPWGALAIGTVIGAALIDLPLHELGLRSAVLTMPVLAGDLIVLWSLARHAGVAPRPIERLDDVLWLSGLLALLWLGNRYLAVEIAGIAATGALVLLRHLRDERPDLDDLRRLARSTAPYALLAMCLLVSRIPAAAEALRALLTIRPAPSWAPYAPFYHGSFWLVAVALAVLTHAGRAERVGTVLAQAWAAGRIPAAVTMIFIVMAQLLVTSGVSAALAHAWAELTGPGAVLISPVLSAVAGFLTGTNVASNSLLMPLQAAIAASAHVDERWLAAIQNTAGSNLTMLSPVRVAMATALVGIAGQERAIYRLTAPLGLVALGVALLATMLI